MDIPLLVYSQFLTKEKGKTLLVSSLKFHNIIESLFSPKLHFSRLFPNFFAAKVGKENDVPVFKLKSWRRAGKVLPEVFDTYKTVNADLNVLPYCSQFIPMEVINHPRLKSICYHPSILPRHRGASSINW